jgi:hypothetical protein
MFLSAVILLGCQEVSKQEEGEVDDDSLSKTSFKDHKEIEFLKGYEKISDTAINMGSAENNFRLMDLKEKKDHLVLFYKIVERDSISGKAHNKKVLDTLCVQKVTEDERLTIGYCFHDDFHEGEVIALVKQTDSLHVTYIVKAWRANPKSGKLEELKDHSDIRCLNEFFEKENATIPFEKIS